MRSSSMIFCGRMGSPSRSTMEASSSSPRKPTISKTWVPSSDVNSTASPTVFPRLSARETPTSAAPASPSFRYLPCTTARSSPFIAASRPGATASTPNTGSPSSLPNGLYASLYWR